jgi:hypothetical protein
LEALRELRLAPDNPSRLIGAESAVQASTIEIAQLFSRYRIWKAEMLAHPVPALRTDKL